MMGGLGPLELIIICLLILPIIYWKYTSSVNRKNHQNKLVITRFNHSTENNETVNNEHIDNKSLESNHATIDSTTEDEKPTTIVQNITYNIHDSAISGDINNEINNK
jgi:hypothetical protein